jgi:hypothetical protein
MRKQKNLIFLAICLTMFALILTQTVNAQQSPLIGSAHNSGMQIQIYSYNTNSAIQYSPTTPSHSGYIWAWVDIALTNIESQDAISTSLQYASLKDSQNNVYTGGVIVSDPQGIRLMDLTCGNSQRGNLYFEIPASANIVSFTWNDNVNNLVIGASSTTPSTAPTGNPSATPTLAPGTSPTQTPASTGTHNPTMTPYSSQNPTPSATIPEFPQTIMLLIVTVMLLIVSTGLVAYRRRNSFVK